ncbi:hypothetical protein V8B55DRAFT_1437232 [Mucor lusitanicus]|uniref:Uncharacterized protein n=1 Tax=Mucor circinelloides f. lusitanicus TaxID=29924 RepID=A0A8H4B8Z2_MUCCL|nr:hypothetical protein FB192DRAFT_1175876 [Mucor lusitanicus]
MPIAINVKQSLALIIRHWKLSIQAAKATDALSQLANKLLPPSSPRTVNTVINDDEVIKYSNSSSVASDKSTYNNLKPTKHCVLDFFNCIASKDAPVNRELYTFGHWNNTELFDFVKSFIPNIVDIYTPVQVTDWLSKDSRFGYSQVARIGGKREKRRSLSIVKRDHWGEC